MVKVQKPNPKTLKKEVPGKPKAIQKKKPNVSPAKEKVKEVVKNVQKATKSSTTKVIKEVKQKTEELSKKSKSVPQKVQKSVPKKQPVVKKAETKPQPQKVVSGNTKIEKPNQKKAPVVKVEAKPIFEQGNFDEDQFKDIVKLENIKKISKALKSLVEKEVSEKKTSIFSDYKYFLNVASYKIPNCPRRIVKLNVKHSLVDTNTDDVVIIVPDLQRGAKVDYEPTIQHYEDLLRENGVDNIKVMPFNQLRNEYSTFEAKRKLANTFDYFLCDGRIVGHVVGFCGKHFQKPRTTIHAVRLDNPKTYKSDIERALKRTSYRQLHKGDLISIPVGSHRFTTNQVAENIESVVEQLKTLFPGGYANIRNIYLKIDIKGTSSMPLYVSLTGAPEETANVIGPREQRLLKLKKQANEILSKFSMSKTGEFIKLNKTQVERKKQIREARAVLMSREKKEIEKGESELPPSKKAKKEKPVEEEEEEDNDEGSDDEVEEGDDSDEEEIGDNDESEGDEDDSDESDEE